MRYPIGVQTFEEMINRDYVYVDRTDLVYSLAQSHICFLSRPQMHIFVLCFLLVLQSLVRYRYFQDLISQRI